MICEWCEGEGYQKFSSPEGALAILPCLECNGSGIASCCDAAGSRPFPASNVVKKSDMGPAVAGEAPFLARGVEEGRSDLLGSADHPLVADEPGDLDPPLGERVRREDDENVDEPNPKGVQNLPHETPPMAGEVNAGVLAPTANRVNAWWEFSTPETMIISECGAEASYRDDTFEPRKCDKCGELYRGPAVYCSMRCALADA